MTAARSAPARVAKPEPAHDTDRYQTDRTDSNPIPTEAQLASWNRLWQILLTPTNDNGQKDAAVVDQTTTATSVEGVRGDGALSSD